MEWITISDKAEEEVIRLVDSQLDMPIGAAFVKEEGEPGWIGGKAMVVRGRMPRTIAFSVTH